VLPFGNRTAHFPSSPLKGENVPCDALPLRVTVKLFDEESKKVLLFAEFEPLNL
tara:strand:- start:305 stop:466 length:162 start_codon:yes stop_codon:yes gene_type:complete